MNCQNLFCAKNNNNENEMSSAENFIQSLSVKASYCLIRDFDKDQKDKNKSHHTLG